MNRLALLLSLVLPVSAYALEPKGNIAGNFPCYDFMELKDKLQDEHGELPFVSAQGATTLLNMQNQKFEIAEHDLYMFANPDTYEYTLVFRMNTGENGVGCVLSSGMNLGPVIQEGI